MAGLISSPVTSLPCTPGRDIHLTVESEESPRSGRDEWRRRRWNKRWAVALAILNGLDISSLSALRDLSTGAGTMVRIPWPPVGMEQATPEMATAKMHNSMVCRMGSSQHGLQGKASRMS